MLHAVSLGLALLALWLMLSGMFVTLLVVCGLVSCVAVVWIALRMDVVDHEGHPIHIRTGRWLRYLLWLVGQIVLSNLDVTRRILSPSLPISPTVRRLRASQRTDLGLVIYANSITLTPGTVTIDVEGGEVEVHALSREGIADLEAGEMDRRVRALEESR